MSEVPLYRALSGTVPPPGFGVSGDWQYLGVEIDAIPRLLAGRSQGPTVGRVSILAT